MSWVRECRIRKRIARMREAHEAAVRWQIELLHSYAPLLRAGLAAIDDAYHEGENDDPA